MKFKENVCGNCGLDLTTIEPGRVTEIDETVTTGECPRCHTNRIMVTPEPEPEPKPPVVRGGHRRASEPEPPPEAPTEPPEE